MQPEVSYGKANLQSGVQLEAVRLVRERGVKVS